MPYVTQGTIQVEATSDGMFITITPVSDYHAEHADKEYTVFFVEPEPKAEFSGQSEATYPKPKAEFSGQSEATYPKPFLYNVSERIKVHEKLETIVGQVDLTLVRLIITIKPPDDENKEGKLPFSKYEVTGIKFPAKA